MPDSADTLEVVALEGIPEIKQGDDLAGAIGDSLERQPALLPLRDSDVLVVTQKVVSKAEGAVVDLTTVEPRPEALAFAERFGRDARQVEVVLREARRVVRMDRGVLITETKHGFVCANGGVDASNVGPGSGSLVTLLPADPDASASRIRTRIRERFGSDVPVIVSDSFGQLAAEVFAGAFADVTQVNTNDLPLGEAAELVARARALHRVDRILLLFQEGGIDRAINYGRVLRRTAPPG